jgi:DNA-binding CsgD family transcriptional regulator
MGIEGFAERARHGLQATGATARKRSLETNNELTAQEAQIARLARGGLSNPEIGTRLFISPRTVKYHLRKVFTKLGITSRIELERALPATRPPSRRSSPTRPVPVGALSDHDCPLALPLADARACLRE